MAKDLCPKGVSEVIMLSSDSKERVLRLFYGWRG